VSSGTASGTAVYGQNFYQGPATVTQAGGLSRFGIMGMSGNALEWLESESDFKNDSAVNHRFYAGGDWYTFRGENLSNRIRTIAPPKQEAGLTGGFRVASIPEPRSLSLAATITLGSIGLLQRLRLPSPQRSDPIRL